MLYRIFGELLSFIIPPRRTERLVEALSLSDLQMFDAEEPLPYADPAVAALVWEIKYYAGARALALGGEYLADAVLALAAAEISPPLLPPVPMHAARRRKRGHNQTELLCEALLPHLGGAVRYAPKALARNAD